MSNVDEIEELGRLAAECELRATKPGLEPWEYACLHERERQFRNRQTAEMVRQMSQQPEPKPEIPVEIGLLPRLGIMALAIAIGITFGLLVLPWIAQNFGN